MAKKGIKIEGEKYMIYSSGSFSMGMGSAFIIRKDNGALVCQMTLGCKPTEEVLQNLLDDFEKIKRVNKREIHKRGE